MSEKGTNILGWLTLIAVLAAIWVMFGEGRQTSSIGRGGPLVAGLMERVEQSRKIVLSKADESITIVAKGAEWQILERAGYVADAGKVRGLLRSLALSERREPKTGNAARLERLGLGADAVHVTLLDGEGVSLAALKIGSQRTGADGNSHAYVHVDGEPKSWLVSAVPSIDLDIAHWVDNKIIEINKERISKIAFDVRDGEDYALVRDQQGADFGLNAIKPDEKSVAGYSLNEAAALIADLTFADVRQALGDATPHTTVTVTTFDGLTINMTITSSGDVLWLSTSAAYDLAIVEAGEAGVIHGAPADGKLEADLYNERHQGWQYRLKEGDLQSQTAGRDTYLDKDAAKSVATP